MEEREQFVDIAEIAKRAGRTVATVRKWEARGLIPRSMRAPLTGRRLWLAEEVPLILALATPRSGDEAD